MEPGGQLGRDHHAGHRCVRRRGTDRGLRLRAQAPGAPTRPAEARRAAPPARGRPDRRGARAARAGRDGAARGPADAARAERRGTGQNRRSPSQKERKWDENSSGGFGSGGFG
ncbi:hypothetical protein STTU_6389 [Streptomyces sp. Tu6071]|nr:hypothetical protein STTU_6389 [Streptomyces sp. Tu6071]